MSRPDLVMMSVCDRNGAPKARTVEYLRTHPACVAYRLNAKSLTTGHIIMFLPRRSKRSTDVVSHTRYIRSWVYHC